MKYSEFSEKVLPPVGSNAEEKQQLSQKVSELMMGERAPNISINVIIGSQNDSSATANDKFQHNKMRSEDEIVTFDAAGKPIKGPFEAESKKGTFEKDCSGSSPGTASGDLVIFKKDEQGKLIKIPKDGGIKSPTYVQQTDRNFLSF